MTTPVVRGGAGSDVGSGGEEPPVRSGSERATAADGGFDVAAYVRSPIEVRPGDLDLSRPTPLPLPVVAVVQHLWAVERGILDLMRDLLVTPTHMESRVTAFLNTWAYEQYWLAQTLAAVLEADGRTPAEPGDSRFGRVLRAWDDRVGLTTDAIRTNLLGADVVASHMALGWLATAVAELCYTRLAVIEPRLADLVGRVLPLKERHRLFYAEDARWRLATSGRARSIARRAALRWRWPGARYGGRTAVRPALLTLLADPAAEPAVRAVDAGFAELPGLAGIAPVRRALGRLAR